MSGGHFAYKQDSFQDIAESIDTLIENNDTHGQYTNDTLDRFKECVVLLRAAQVYVQRIDWLVSGGDSEETFHERLESELANLEKKVSCQEH